MRCHDTRAGARGTECPDLPLVRQRPLPGSGSALIEADQDAPGASMTADDFYCDEVLSGRTPVRVVEQTEHVLAYHHTRPAYPVHVVVIPRSHIASLLALDAADHDLIAEMVAVI